MSHSVKRKNKRPALRFEQLEDRSLCALTANLVKDINTSASFNQGSSNPAGFVAVGDKVYFSAETLNEGRELWRSNGTAAGTQLVKNINPFSTSSNPTELANMNGTLYFVADDGTPGVEIWRTNGTAAGTKLVKDLPEGTSNEAPRDFTAVGSKVFFIREGGAFSSVHELWVTNGTPQSTKKLKDFDSVQTDGGIVAFNGELYFSAWSGNDGMELWKSDGTVAGTQMVVDIQPVQGFAFSSFPKQLTVVKNLLYFTATTADFGTELWRTDGTAAGTRQVRDIAPDTDSSTPANLTNVNGTLFFTTTIGGTNTQLYRSRGTASSTVQVKDLGAPSGLGGAPTELTAVGKLLFFSGTSPTAGNAELWKSNGTTAGTQLVKDIEPGTGSSFPQALTNVNGRLFFRTGNDDLWTSNGTTAGTTMVVDSTQGFFAPADKEMAVANGVLFFAMHDTTHGRELWRADRSQPPVLTIPPRAFYSKEGAPIVLAPTATVSDSDSANLKNGRLTVELLANAAAGDRLLIRNQKVGPGKITVSGSKILYGGIAIGTFSGGLGAPLEIVLNAKASLTATQALLRSILFKSSKTPSSLVRKVSFTLTDGDGGSSLPRTMIVRKG